MNLRAFFKRIKDLPPLPRRLLYGLGVFLALFILVSAIVPAVMGGGELSFNTGDDEEVTPTPNVAEQLHVKVSPMLFGSNFTLDDNSDQLINSDDSAAVLRQLHLRMLRIPLRGNLSDESLKKAIELTITVEATPLFVFHNITDPKFLDQVKNMIAILKEAERGTATFPILYFEVGSQVDLQNMNADTYTALWNKLVPELRKLLPSSRFVGPVTSHYDRNFLKTFLQQANPKPDDVSWHEYACVSSSPQSECMAGINEWSKHVTDARVVINDALGYTVPIMITEWNYAASVSGNDGKNNDEGFMTNWTIQAIQTLAKSQVAASMQYAATSSVPLVTKYNTVSPQGNAFIKLYDQVKQQQEDFE